MLDRIVVASECEFELDGLLEPLEAPVALFRFEVRYTKEFRDGCGCVF